MTNTAPYQLNLGPGASADLSVYCGSDWALDVPFTAADGTTAVNVSAPSMQIRATAANSSPVLITPTLSVAANVVSVRIPGSASKGLAALSGYYDLFVTRSDTSGPIKLAFGTVTIIPETTLT